MGVALKKWSLRRAVNKGVGAFVHWIDLNAVSLEEGVVFKRRNAFGRRVAGAANWFFRACRAPIVFWKEVRSWQRWEVECYRMLHPAYQALAVGEDAVCLERLPGEALFEILKRGEVTAEMLQAAAREMRRAHGIWSEEYRGRWSHGDGAMGNMLYDAATGEAHFIDFELMHDRSLSAEERQADDLHAFLMDLASYSPRRQWLPFALAFLREYGDRAVLAELRKRLPTPRGMGWVWWKIRGNFAAEAKLAGRFEQLGRGMDRAFQLKSKSGRRKRAAG